jgi:hypothetical protein
MVRCPDPHAPLLWLNRQTSATKVNLENTESTRLQRYSSPAFSFTHVTPLMFDNKPLTEICNQ